jgi:hypothetical protein
MTCCDFGKSLSIAGVGNTSFVSPLSVGTMPTEAGWSDPKYNTASDLPEASGVGETSTHLLEICRGVPPATGTDQMWRFSMSFAFVA